VASICPAPSGRDGPQGRWWLRVAHFFGDLERRRDILDAFREGRAPDFSRAFSARPQARARGSLRERPT
jgi:hypothetical protein